MAAVETASLPWPSSLPELKRLDDLLRCGICYEFSNTSMVTACSHNYCSLCIRQYLTYKTQCPACFSETTGQQLRNNRLLDEVIGLFPSLRDKVARHFQRSKGSTINGYLEKKELSNNFNENDDDSETIDHIFDESFETKSPQASTSSRLITKQDKNESIRMEKFSSSPLKSSKNAFPSSPLKSSKNAFPSSPLKSSKNAFFSPRSSKGQSSFLNHKPFTGSQSPSSSSSRTEHNLDVPMRSSQTGSFSSPKQSMPQNQSMAGHFSIQRSPCPKGKSEEATATCPVCAVSVPERNINLHLDACLQRTEKENTQQVIKSSCPRRKNMAKLVYSLLNEKQLRVKLKEVGLNNQGDKQTLMRRHQRYTVLYNAECDLESPRPLSELVRHVEREERDVKGTKQQKTIFNYDRKSAPEVIEKEQKEYVKKNSSNFASLIADVKRRREEAKKNKEMKKEVESNTSDSVCNESSTSNPLNNSNKNSNVKPRNSQEKADTLLMKTPIKSTLNPLLNSVGTNLKEINDKFSKSVDKVNEIEDKVNEIYIRICNEEEEINLDDTQPMEDLSDLEELDEPSGSSKSLSPSENSVPGSPVHSECSNESNESFSLLQELDTQEQEIQQISSPELVSTPDKEISLVTTLKQVSDDSEPDTTEENVRRSSRSRNSNKRTFQSVAQQKELLDALGPETQMLSDDDEMFADFDYNPTQDLDDEDFTGFPNSRRSLRSKRQKCEEEIIMPPPLKKVVRKKRK